MKTTIKSVPGSEASHASNMRMYLTIIYICFCAVTCVIASRICDSDYVYGTVSRKNSHFVLSLVFSFWK